MTGIQWTEVTWNPVTGCDTISPGCDHCYARTLAKRLKAMGNLKYQADGNPVTSGPGFGVTCHPEALALPYRWRKPRLVFVNSMADLFHARVPEAFIAEVLTTMYYTPQHTYQVLTKRPERAAALGWTWPPNVWLGVSVESDGYARRTKALADTFVTGVRFISAEPLLGPLPSLDLSGIGWLIAGGESGPGHRTPDLDWFRDLRDRCGARSIPFFYKQFGGHTPKAGGRLLDGRTWDEMPPTTLTTIGGTR